MKKALLILVTIATTGIIFQSCKKEDTSPTKGSMNVKMTDAPGNYTALDVEITKVEAYLQNEGWVSLNNQSQVVSVLDLTNGASTSIGSSTSLDAGLYTKLRLTFGNNNNLSVGAGSGSSQFALDFGSNFAQQVEVEINEQVSANNTTDVLIDFNVAESIIELGNTYIIQPAITEIEDTSTGVYGEVNGAIQASVTLSNGTNSFSTFIDANGQFRLQGMDDGTYNLIVSGIRDGQAQVSETTVNNVVVVEGGFTNTGSIQL